MGWDLEDHARRCANTPSLGFALHSLESGQWIQPYIHDDLRRRRRPRTTKHIVREYDFSQDLQDSLRDGHDW